MEGASEGAHEGPMEGLISRADDTAGEMEVQNTSEGPDGPITAEIPEVEANQEVE